MSVRTAAVIALLFATACDSDSAGSVATHTEVTDVLPQLPADASLPPQEPRRVEVTIHCGVAWFQRPINGMWWYADEAPNETYWTPDEWRTGLAPGEQDIEVEVELSSDGTVLVASRNGREVTYKPVPHSEPAWCA